MVKRNIFLDLLHQKTNIYIFLHIERLMEQNVKKKILFAIKNQFIQNNFA